MSENACPVDHDTRQAWLDQQRSSSSSQPSVVSASGRHFGSSSRNNDAARADAFFQLRSSASQTFRRTRPGSQSHLSDERVISSIPRARPISDDLSSPNGGETSGSLRADAENPKDHWVYPSPSQFYSALQRKNHSPRSEDMDIVVPIHNAVNERAWSQIQSWEAQFHPEVFHDSSNGSRGGLKLVSFEGKPKQQTWKAWLKTTFGGSSPPFDRHDWLIDRNGQQVRYIIDFYTGKSPIFSEPPREAAASPGGFVAAASAPNLAFYLDVRPAPDSLDNLRMRLSRTLLGEPRQPAPNSAS